MDLRRIPMNRFLFRSVIASLSLCLHLAAPNAFAETKPGTPLSPQLALSKIRDRLLGDWPTIQEWKELDQEMKVRECAAVPCLSDFFKRKIKEYMATPRYVGRMALKVEELFYIRSGSYPWDRVLSGPQSPNPSYGASDRNSIDMYNSFSDLARSVFQEDRPWDELFTAKSYEIFPKISDSAGRSEASFYNVDAAPTVFTYDTGGLPEAKKLDLSSNPNVSGVFSTPRFLTRFWNSSLNQGRKRSAAVFRVMVCDTLFPSLERKSMAADEVSKALGSSQKTIADAHKSEMVNRHATDPACIRCHERLDPLAWTMRGLEVGLSQRAFPGYVRFYDTAGKLTKFKVESFDEAIATFTKQEKYRSCQVDRFFKWVIGKDVEISPERLLELETDFDKFGRKTNDYIAHLLLSKEFMARPTPKQKPTSVEGTLYERATAVFTNCVVCHGSSYPFTDLKRWDKLRLGDVASMLDLKNNGLNREMPPPSYKKWQPSSDDLQAIKAWIGAGGPGEDGKSILSASEAKALVEK